ncbi:hypothetical protein MLD38_023897 [Melastoma candidum]|uniref:Uncharacterized protein n=1 Tax=Melastoma candidum TaxID=119954 RepID=A0ACB9NQP8_9MYRT|nr:hypothetical protein MLD38_023897 [Melastoma candidum]
MSVTISQTQQQATMPTDNVRPPYGFPHTSYLEEKEYSQIPWTDLRIQPSSPAKTLCLHITAPLLLHSTACQRTGDFAPDATITLEVAETLATPLSWLPLLVPALEGDMEKLHSGQKILPESPLGSLVYIAEGDSQDHEGCCSPFLY